MVFIKRVVCKKKKSYFKLNLCNSLFWVIDFQRHMKFIMDGTSYNVRNFRKKIMNVKY